MQSKPRVVGLDLSLTATGIAAADSHTHTVTGGTGDRRLIHIADAIDEATSGCTLVVIEDLPHSAMGGSSTGMVQGIARERLMRADIPYVLVVAATLKLYATGKGTANKPQMAVAAFKRAGAEFADDNQCDAAWLRWLGLDLLGHPQFELPAANRKALLKVELPERLRP